MSSARIPPSRRSPSIRSHPCPRSWNGNSGCVIAVGVGSGWKCRSSPPCSRSVEHLVERHLAELETRLVRLEARHRTHELDDPRAACAASRGNAAPSRHPPAAAHATCPPICTNGSVDVTSSCNSSSLSSLSPIARRQSNDASSAVPSSPLERARRIALRRRLQVHAQLARRRAATPTAAAPARRAPRASGSLRAGRTSRDRDRASASAGSSASNAMPPSASTGSMLGEPADQRAPRIARAHEREHLVAALAPQQRRRQAQRRVVLRLQPHLQARARRPRARRDAARPSTATCSAA